MTAELKKGKYIYYRCTGFKGRCGNTYIRKEALSELLGGTVQGIQIPQDVADEIATSLLYANGQLERERCQAKQRLEQRRESYWPTGSRLRRFRERKDHRGVLEPRSEQWEDERRVVEGELARLEQANGNMAITGEQIFELAKKAGFLDETQDPTEQRRLLETVLSNCSFDRGTLCPTYTKPFDLFAQANETGDWRRERDSNPR